MKYSDITTQQLQVIDLNDYFGAGEGPNITEPISKEDFEAEYGIGDNGDDEVSFEDYMAGSGDGCSNYVVVTIVDSKVVLVKP